MGRGEGNFLSVSFFFLIEVQSIYSVLISSVQQGVSVMHVYVLFHIIFHYPRILSMLYPVLHSRTLMFIHSIYTSLLYAFNKALVSVCVCPCVCRLHSSYLEVLIKMYS